MTHSNPPPRLARQATSLTRLSLLACGALTTAASWAAVTPGTSFGTDVNAGGRVAGGAFQSAASGQYANTNAKALARGSSDSFSLHASLLLALAGLACIRAGAWLTRRASS